MDRKIDGYWWTWQEGAEWPSWYYSEQMAREAANRLARGSPGRRVYVGDLNVIAKKVLPDKLVDA